MLREDIGIVVVDDVNAMRVQIKELLRSFGFRKVSLASSGEEAKKMIEAGDCHLVLADWLMTPTNGIDLLKYVRANPELQKLAFIMISAENSREKVIEAIKYGVDDYLIKPLTPVQIQNKVYGVLLKKQVLS